MAPLSPERVELARRIVQQEAGGSDPAASIAAVESACRSLQEHLIDALGTGGVAAVLGRALHLARREQPLLSEVSVSREPGACFSGLTESLGGSSDPEAAAAATTILAHLLDLLVVLLGEELGMKPVRKLWPPETRVKETDG